MTIHNITCHKLNLRYHRRQPFISNGISFSVDCGELLAIMGPSGSGKSTLLNGLLGRLPVEPGQGRIFVNGHDATDKGLGSIKDRVGFVPQQDILVAELTVLENILSFHTIAVDSDLSPSEVKARAETLLQQLGLGPDAAGKKPAELSGGQRKRVSIIMELVNDPDVLIIDEPTSGLSSADALEIMGFVSGLARQRQKIVMAIIHQPGSAIFRLFDKLVLLQALNGGGRGECVASGTLNQIYQANKERILRHQLVCDHCHTLFPEQLLEWTERGLIRAPRESAPPEPTPLHPTPLLRSPFETLKDFHALVRRQLRIKSRDRLSQLLTFAVPPLLGFLIAVVFKFSPPGGHYRFAGNGLFGQFVFMMLISGLFLGLISSVGEVIRDRPMLYRESLRGLRFSAYYLAKLLVLAFFGAIQALLFTGVAFHVLDASQYWWPNLWMMFAAIGLSLSLGLVISIWVKTAISAYNLIPLLLIPQIVLGGALLPFSSMGKEIYLWQDPGPQMPLLARIMPSSWLYEETMALNHHYSRQHQLKQNQNVAQMTLHQPGDFLALRKISSLRDPPAGWLGLAKGDNHTRVFDAFILALTILGLVGLGLIDVRRGFTRSAHGRLFMRGLLGLSLVSFGLWAYKPLAHAAGTQTNPGLVVSDHGLNGEAAVHYCTNQGRTLATPERIAQAFNRGALPPAVYWTNRQYHHRDNARWSLDLTQAQRPVVEQNILADGGVAVAYPVMQFSALAVCIRH